MYDIIGFSETKLNEEKVEAVDTVSIEHFTLFHKFRHHKNPSRSGGLCVAIKNCIVEKVKILKCDNSEMIWLQIEEDKNILLILIIYTPPENSPYAQPEFFNILENEIMTKRNISTNIIIMGDFNAHTKEREDYIADPITSSRELYIDISVQTKETLNIKDIPLTRINADTTAPNNWGRRLIDTCKNTNILIMNGRKGLLSSRTTTTFNTVIDYILADNGLFHKINNVKVHDFDSLFSDVHCLISCEYEVDGAYKNGSASRQSKHTQMIEIIKPWDSSKTQQYIEMVEK
jgi:exonuclease III